MSPITPSSTAEEMCNAMERRLGWSGRRSETTRLIEEGATISRYEFGPGSFELFLRDRTWNNRVWADGVRGYIKATVRPHVIPTTILEVGLEAYGRGSQQACSVSAALFEDGFALFTNDSTGFGRHHGWKVPLSAVPEGPVVDRMVNAVLMAANQGGGGGWFGKSWTASSFMLERGSWGGGSVVPAGGMVALVAAAGILCVLFGRDAGCVE